MIQNVTVELSANSIQIVPGETFELGVTVTNNSQEVERFELSIADLDPAWYQFDWAEMLLYPNPPGNESTSYVRFSIPPDARPGTYAPVIEITDSHMATIHQSFLLTIAQVAEEEIGLSLEPESQETAASMARYKVNLKNPQSKPVSLQLVARSARPDVRIIIAPPVVDLDRFSELPVMLEVRPLRRNWYKSPQRYDFSVGLEGTDREVQGFLVQTCSLPWLRQLLTTPALLAAALLLPLLLFGLAAVLLWPHPADKTATLYPPAQCVAPASGRTATLQTQGDRTDIIVVEPDGTRRVVGFEEASTMPGLYASLLSISPNGSTLAYVAANNEAMDGATIYTVNLTSPGKQRITTIPTGFWPSRPIWSNNNQLSYIVRNNKQLELWTVNLNEAEPKPQQVTPRSQINLRPDFFYQDPGDGPMCWSADNTRLVIRPKNQASQTEVVVDGSLNNGQVFTRSTRPPTPIKVDSRPRELPLAPAREGTPCFVQTYSQNDPQWFDQLMRPANEKIGTAGCPLASAAMLLNYYNVPDIDPGKLNSNCLTDQSLPFDWFLPPRNCSQGRVQGGVRQDFSWTELNNGLQRGQPVIVGMLGGQTGTHYVVVVGGSDSIASTYRVNDPFDGTNYKSLGYFLDKGYVLRWIVNYSTTATDAPACATRIDPGQALPFNFKLLSPVDGKMYNFKGVPVSYSFDPPGVVSGTLIFKPRPTTQTAAPLAQSNPYPANGSTLDNEGLYTLNTNFSGDNATSQLTTNFVIDYSPPTVGFVSEDSGLIFDPTTQPNAKRVAHKPVPLAFSAKDDLTGIAFIEYRVNDTDWIVFNNDIGAVPPQISQSGDYTLVYRATDGAGNRSEEKTISFTVDVPAAVDPNATPTLPPAATTQVAQTQPAVTTTAAPAGTDNGNNAGAGAAGQATTLQVAPNAITFDPTQNQVFIQLSNPGPGVANWTIQPPTDAGASFLDFSPRSGSIPAGAPQVVTVNLTKFNTTGAPVSTSFSITYNNNPVPLPVSVSIAPQPNPVVQFVSPAPGPIVNRNVTIKLQVGWAGRVVPNHATINASFIDQIGTNPIARPLQGQATLQNDWTITWDTTSLPFQSPINLSADICWSADESACVKNAATVNGLSIVKPGATVTLNPASDKLYGTVNISAETTGTVDHISFKYTTKDGTFDLPPATPANNYTTKWDTTTIPPQDNITLAILVCGTADETNCSQPTNQAQLPPSFSVEKPVMTLNPLADADSKDLPLSLTLSGTGAKINNPAATVYITAKGTGLGTDPVFKTGGLTLGSAPSNWSLTIDTKGWSNGLGGTITFDTKICWDDKETVCNPGPSLTAAILPFTAEFDEATKALDNQNLPGIATLVARPVPATSKRITVIKFFLSWTNSNSLPGLVDIPDTEQTGSSNKLTFDSIALGLKPGKAIFKLQACADTVCGALSAPLLTLVLPDSDFDPQSLTPAPNVLSATPLPANLVQTITANVKNRGATRVDLRSYYRLQPGALTTAPISKTAVSVFQPTVNQKVQFDWNFLDLPPQNNISLTAAFCWSGSLDKTEYCNEKPLYSGLFMNEPRVSNFYLNYLDGPYLGDSLPVAITSSLTASPSLSVTIPVDADVVNAKNVYAVKWQLLAQQGTNPPVVLDTTTTTTDPNTGKGGVGGKLKLPLNATVLGVGTAITLTATPIWTNVFDNTTVDYSFSVTDTKQIPVKLVNTTVSFNGSGAGATPINIVPPSGSLSPNATLMYRQTTVIAGTLSPAIGTASPVSQMLFYITTDTAASPQFLGSATPVVDPVKNNLYNWSLPWNHGADNLTTRPGLENLILLSWRYCNSPTPIDPVTQPQQANAYCTPLLQPINPLISPLDGSVDRLNNLKLVGVQFVDSNLLDATEDLLTQATAGSFNSTFTTTIELKNTSVFTGTGSPGLVRQFHIFAYPAPPTGTIPTTTNRLELSVAKVITSADGSSVTLKAFWPDDGANISSLLTAVQATASKKLNIGVQYCTTITTNPDDPSCSDWSGLEMGRITTNTQTTIPPWQAVVQASQLAVIVWKPYHTGACAAPSPNEDPCPPIDDYVDRGIDVSFVVDVYTINGGTQGCPVLTNGTLNLSYSSPRTLDVTRQRGDIFAVPVSSATTNGLRCRFIQPWSASDIGDIGFPSDPTFTSRSVDLIATLTFGSGTNIKVLTSKIPTNGFNGTRPIISNVIFSRKVTIDATGGSTVTTFSPTITWTTDLASNTGIKYGTIPLNQPVPSGTTATFVSTPTDGGGVTVHSQTAPVPPPTAFTNDTFPNYYFRVVSQALPIPGGAIAFQDVIDANTPINIDGNRVTVTVVDTSVSPGATVGTVDVTVNWNTNNTDLSGPANQLQINNGTAVDGSCSASATPNCTATVNRAIAANYTYTIASIKTTNLPAPITGKDVTVNKGRISDVTISNIRATISPNGAGVKVIVIWDTTNSSMADVDNRLRVNGNNASPANTSCSAGTCTASVTLGAVPANYTFRITSIQGTTTSTYNGTLVAITSVSSTLTISGGANVTVAVNWTSNGTGDQISVSGTAAVAATGCPAACTATATVPSQASGIYSYAITSNNPTGGTTVTNGSLTFATISAPGAIVLNGAKTGGTISWTTNISANCSIAGTGLPGGATLAVTSTEPNTNHTATAAGFTNNATSANFNYTITCTAGGNTTKRAGTFTIPDNVAPTINTPTPSAATNPTTLNWTTSENAVCTITAQTFSITAGGGTVTTESVGTGPTASGTSHSVNITNLQAGQTYSLNVTIRCTDTAGNVTTQSFTGITFTGP